MTIDWGKISSKDRSDYERRLKIYGLDTSSVQDALTIPTGKINLSFGPRAESARQPFVIKTNNFAEVKRMVGIDDRIAEIVTPRITLPGPINIRPRNTNRLTNILGNMDRSTFLASPGIEKQEADADSIDDNILSQMDAAAVTDVRLAARAFVRGNSKLVASYAPLFSRIIGEVTIPVWPIFSVHVSKGSVLEFGKGVHALVAFEVVIEEGGLIRSHGNLTVNCVRLRRPSGGLTIPNLGLTTPFRPIFSE